MRQVVADRYLLSIDASKIFITDWQDADEGADDFQAIYAFQSALVGYLALKNLLALANDNDLSSRLASYSVEEFKDWLDRIDQGCSVTG